VRTTGLRVVGHGVPLSCHFSRKENLPSAGPGAGLDRKFSRDRMWIFAVYRANLDFSPSSDDTDLVSVVGNSAAKLDLAIILTGHWILMISASPAPA
jgi:hypothetical protein